MEHRALRTNLTVEQCQQRLEERTHTGLYSTWLTDRPVAGQIWSKGFWIWKTNRRHGNNAAQIEARGTYMPQGRGARILIDVGIDRGRLYSNGLGVIAITVFLTVILAGSAQFAMLLVPLGMILMLGGGIYWWLLQDDGGFLFNFLLETLDGEECEPPAPRPAT